MPKVSLTRVRLNNGGYDSTGYYFGIGMPLFCAVWEDETECHSHYLRAYDRDDAKEQVKAMLPGATFYR